MSKKSKKHYELNRRKDKLSSSLYAMPFIFGSWKKTDRVVIDFINFGYKGMWKKYYKTNMWGKDDKDVFDDNVIAVIEKFLMKEKFFSYIKKHLLQLVGECSMIYKSSVFANNFHYKNVLSIFLENGLKGLKKYFHKIDNYAWLVRINTNSPGCIDMTSFDIYKKVIMRFFNEEVKVVTPNGI